MKETGSLGMGLLVDFHQGLVEGLVRLAVVVWKDLQVQSGLRKSYFGTATFFSFAGRGITYFWVWLA